MVRAKSLSRFTGSHIYGSTGSEPPNPLIPSAMAMAMSIYRTLCVLVLLQEHPSLQRGHCALERFGAKVVALETLHLSGLRHL